MPSRHERIRSAVNRHARLVAEPDKRSAPLTERKVGVFVSLRPPLNTPERDYPWERSQLRRGANRLADTIRTRGLPVELCADSSVAGLIEMLRDPTITDLHIGGHGSFTGLAVDNAGARTLSADMLSRKADHLKTGAIYQHTCGLINRGELPIPVGTFVAADQREIYLAPRRLFETRHLGSAIMARLFEPVFSLETNSLEDFEELEMTEFNPAYVIGF